MSCGTGLRVAPILAVLAACCLTCSVPPTDRSAPESSSLETAAPARPGTAESGTSADDTVDAEVEPLTDQARLRRSLAEGQVHSYSLHLDRGHILWLVAEQNAIDVILSVVEPEGRQVSKIDGPNGPDGPEYLILQAETTGEHRLTIEGGQGQGTYSLTIGSAGPATAEIRALCRALARYDQATELLHADGARSIESAAEILGQALADLPPSSPGLIRARFHRRLGQVQREHGRFVEAGWNLATARDLLLQHGNGWEQAPALNDLGDVLLMLGDFGGAEAALRLALGYAENVGNRRAAAVARNNLGVVYAHRGEPSDALEAYGMARDLWQDLGDKEQETRQLHNIGTQFLALGRTEDGLDYLRQAVAARRADDDLASLGRSLASLAWGLGLAKRSEDALKAYEEALFCLETAGANYDKAVALEQRSRYLLQLNRLEESRVDLEESLRLVGEGSPDHRLHGAYLRLGLAIVLRRLDQPAVALPVLLRAARELEDFQVHDGRVLALAELARAYHALGQLEPAVEHLEEALVIVETARRNLRLASFRRSYLGGHHDLYSELIDRLAEAAIEAETPGQRTRFASRAFEVNERRIARTLSESLMSPSESSGCSAPGDLCKRQRDLLSRLERLESSYLVSSPMGATGGPRSVLEDLRRLRRELEQIQERIERSAGQEPADAIRATGEPVRLNRVFDELDEDTLLLAYALGEKRSWLWTLQRTRVDGLRVDLFQLLPKVELERAARRVHELLSLPAVHGFRSATNEALRHLSDLLLPPLSRTSPAQLTEVQPRIVVIPDGALHLLPFDVLPSPGQARAEPLIARYEVVQLPSASVLVHLRQRLARRRDPARRFLAIVAAPVFGPEVRTGEISANLSSDGDLAGTREALGGRFIPLPGTLDEARQIGRIAQTQAPAIITGFDANREFVLSGGLSDYRILHLATHGLVDAEDPRVVGLVLSLIDRQGHPRDGLLRARDFYALKISADLVVLSACRTALGHDIRGEGLVGLTHGVFAAGASHVIVSFWDVNDRATASLMVRFYNHLLGAGARPAEALRRAKLELIAETPWQSPKYWAAFAALGDWRIRIAG